MKISMQIKLQCCKKNKKRSLWALEHLSFMQCYILTTMQVSLSCLSCLFIISGLIDEIRGDIGILTLLAEVLCLLDMIVNSFAHTISTKPVDRYTRPEFTGVQFSSCHVFSSTIHFTNIYLLKPTVVHG